MNWRLARLGACGDKYYIDITVSTVSTVAKAPNPDPNYPHQASLLQMGTPLEQVTFVVVDLETTGAQPGPDAITEFGAVRVRGGEILDEFGSLANPGTAVPAYITMLTGITTSMVASAPPLEEVLGDFMSWARLDEPDTVIVAHNARFDVSHLRSAAGAFGFDWPSVRVLDTLKLTRKAWSRNDVANHKLSTLARFVGAQTTPTHRALDDARATVDVLYAALEKVALQGLTHMEDLTSACDPVPASRRAKATMAADLPQAPGVYRFYSPGNQVLYVGSATNLRQRVRSYFTASESRGHIATMLDVADRVEYERYPTLIEARVQELRQISFYDPPANRRSRKHATKAWLKLTAGPRPRLSIVSYIDYEQLSKGGVIGPYSSRRSANAARVAIEEVFALDRVGDKGISDTVSDEDYPALADLAHQALSDNATLVVDPLMQRIQALAQVQRYEDAGVITKRLQAYVRGLERVQRLRPLFTCPYLVSARRRSLGGWEFVAISHGRLLGSAVSPSGVYPLDVLAEFEAFLSPISPPERIMGTLMLEEANLLADWALDEGARLVSLDPQANLSWPIDSPARHAKLLAHA